MLNWDFKKLSTKKYESNTYEVSKKFDDISLHTDCADIVFALSNDGSCKVECYEEEKTKHFVEVKNGMLTVEAVDKRSVFDYIGLNFDMPTITVYLPKTDYNSLSIDESTGDIEIPNGFTFKDVDISLSTGDVNFYATASDTVKIKTTTGKVHAENISLGALELSVTTGEVTVSNTDCKGNISVRVTTGKTMLTDITCQNLLSTGNTGDITLANVKAYEKFSIERSTGDVKFENSDAGEIFVKTDTGNVTGSLLTDKVFITETDTGNVDVPKTVNGGKCEISTDTGDVSVKVKH